MQRLTFSCMSRVAAAYGRVVRHLPPTRHQIVKLAPNSRDTFFGYYDKTPFSGDGTRVLGLNLREDSSTADVGYFDLRSGRRFVPVGETTTWSWQLGARLQWIPGRENDLIGYNKLVGGRHGFVIQNAETEHIEAQYEAPVFDISSDGRSALSLNFARLRRMRAGYGYGAMKDPGEKELAPGEDGVVLLDLLTGSRELLVSLAELKDREPRNSMEGAEHYVNHLAFAPSGGRFLFLHLWNRDGQRYSRPITVNPDGSDLFILENSLNMSHYAWKSDSELLIHTSRRPFGTRFVLYRDRTADKRVIGGKALSEPGHPSYAPDGGTLVVDTYPDATRRQHLLLCTEEGELIEELGRFYSPRGFSGARKCDLHPRWDRTGARICIDSAHDGQRAIYLIDLK